MTFLALTPGDPSGIGPEVTWKALRNRARRGLSSPILCVGARAPFEKLRARIIAADPSKLEIPREKEPFVWLLEAPVKAPTGRLLGGYQAGWSIETATRLVLKRKASAIVTGPISKERLSQGGYRYPGHTEFLATLCGTPEVTMMLANDQLRISLATVHLALKDVSRKLRAEHVRRAVLQTVEALHKRWKIKKPRVAVAALNPHAGESGMFGTEEIRIISPELKRLQRLFKNQAEIIGPLPADTLFAKHIESEPKNRYDAVVCMYHDQGLIPVKLLDFHRTVNITLGLPIVRTSVDHGVGFDIAGKGVANPSSLESAIDLAFQMTQR